MHSPVFFDTGWQSLVLVSRSKPAGHTQTCCPEPLPASSWHSSPSGQPALRQSVDTECAVVPSCKPNSSSGTMHYHDTQKVFTIKLKPCHLTFSGTGCQATSLILYWAHKCHNKGHYRATEWLIHWPLMGWLLEYCSIAKTV